MSVSGWNGVWCVCCNALFLDDPISSTQARGEAEAELAYLNAQGIIDAIITDDVDALVFGARVLIKK